MLYVLRHGKTDLNGAHALQGRSDLPLNEEGTQQAREVARRLLERGVVFSHVFSSPLQRAVQTARIVASGVDVVCDDRLLEMDYGPYEGYDLRNLTPELAEFFRDFVHNPAPSGMEQLSSVVERTGAFVEDVRALAAEANVLVSTHAIAMKGVLEYLTPESHGSYWSTYVGNCAIYVVECAGGTYGIPTELQLGVSFGHPGE